MSAETKWTLHQEQRWPFRYQILAADGEEILRQDLYAYSTKDETADEASARPGNDRQRERLALMTEAPALREALEHMQWCRNCAEGSWADCDGGRAANAALRRARGETP